MKINPILIQFSVKLNNVIFPIDPMTFNRNLALSGFVPVREGQQLPNELVINEGDIATKNNVIISLNVPTMFVGVAGTDPREMINIFNELDLILAKSGVTLNENGRFYELVAEYVIESDKSPMKSIQKFYSTLKTLEQFDKILDTQSSLFGVRIIPKDAKVDSENYYEVKVEPLILRSNNAYHTYSIYRNKDRVKTENFTLHIEDKLKSIVDVLEKSI